MTDIKMLPLPGSLSHWLKMRASDSEESAVMHVAVHHHARAVAEHNVRFLTHELANAECVIDAEQAGRKKAEAEIEALRERHAATERDACRLASRLDESEKQAEALRAEVVRWKSNYNAAIELKGRAFAERDRLEETLRMMEALLDEVRSHFTRDDDLPDDLLPRIDANLELQQSAADEPVDDEAEAWALFEKEAAIDTVDESCKHDFRRDEDNGGNCCQLCDEVKP